ncbi:hypothetical protein BC826DRAFT_1086096 [Russula brevipes]|nr:hypothetical protein BC826DRAFT_1086096 [Russula brevipes]
MASRRLFHMRERSRSSHRPFKRESIIVQFLSRSVPSSQHLFKTRKSWTVGSAGSWARRAPLGGLKMGSGVSEGDVLGSRR